MANLSSVLPEIQPYTAKQSTFSSSGKKNPVTSFGSNEQDSGATAVVSKHLNPVVDVKETVSNVFTSNTGRKLLDEEMRRQIELESKYGPFAELNSSTSGSGEVTLDGGTLEEAVITPEPESENITMLLIIGAAAFGFYYLVKRK